MSSRHAGLARARVASLCAALATSAWFLLSALHEPFPIAARMDPQPASSFAALVQRLSEPGGDFDTDNLISNERSYLHVIPALKAARVVGGAYVGVGPDQNFSYIAQVRPTLAFIVDVRRDNLLLHLLFKALFAQARNRAEYICLLMGRTVPDRVESWQDAALDKILAYIDGTTPNPTSVDSLRRRLDDA